MFGRGLKGVVYYTDRIVVIVTVVILLAMNLPGDPDLWR